ncbi:nicotinamidase-related amidase [Rhodococcus sp. PvR044]|uniref:cysteine hydrolase family protein n=1 Tax=unclassified Rhodococcus (in: high G+C Gram-positive bacteria) TaxID=192944 RepID=UPI000BC6C405|nr:MULTISPECIES: isochorismatase family protein [unclassified Rhodococcus (in: high G+C Gram-positive bacteria)]MBP1162060.1 nicotinamidase-related amidase [Rhodococcus sp. PvR099]PTR43230.1 nicotinamidase-related amidase [Rhodococcus sp. OK611]SNX91093.1 Nicotinamidase-related amidase [Rhodococcus sp. OK270]
MATTTALIEIDFQHWIVALAHDREVVGRAALARTRFRTEGALVVCTRYLSTDPTDPMRSDPAGHGASFHPVLAPDEGDQVLTKYDRDVFTNPDLDTNLRLRGITDVVFTGIATEHGVALAARSARALGYRVSVIADACAGTTVGSHHRALAALATEGITVVRADACAGVHSST